MSAALWDKEGRAAIMARAFKVGHHYPENWQRSVGREMTRQAIADNDACRPFWEHETRDYWQKNGKGTDCLAMAIQLTLKAVTHRVTTLDVAEATRVDVSIVLPRLTKLAKLGYIRRVGSVRLKCKGVICNVAQWEPKEKDA